VRNVKRGQGSEDKRGGKGKKGRKGIKATLCKKSFESCNN